MSAAGCLVVKPRRILLFLFAGLIVTSILCMKISGYAGVAMIILTMFFEVSNFLDLQFKQHHGQCWLMLHLPPVGYLFNYVCNVHPRSWIIYQDRLHLPHSSSLWRRHRACHHEHRHQKPGRTVRLLCSSRLLHMRGCLARLFGNFPCGESTSWSCAREPCAIVIYFFAFYHPFPTEEETLFVWRTNGAVKRGWIRTPLDARSQKEPAIMMCFIYFLF